MEKPAIIRCLTIGDARIGKSALLKRYTSDIFDPEYIPTIGIDFGLKITTIENKPYKIQIWDSAGTERYRSITHSYYRCAYGIILVYDVTSKSSFNNLRKWIADIQYYCKSDVKIIIIGNKCDNVDKRLVSYREGISLANEFNIPFFECSAKSNYNVQQAFLTLMQNILQSTTFLKDQQTLRTGYIQSSDQSNATSDDQLDDKSYDQSDDQSDDQSNKQTDDQSYDQSDDKTDYRSDDQSDDQSDKQTDDQTDDQLDETIGNQLIKTNIIFAISIIMLFMLYI
jgi:Ras-related protein Rab-8A